MRRHIRWIPRPKDSPKLPKPPVDCCGCVCCAPNRPVPVVGPCCCCGCVPKVPATPVPNAPPAVVPVDPVILGESTQCLTNDDSYRSYRTASPGCSRKHHHQTTLQTNLAAAVEVAEAGLKCQTRLSVAPAPAVAAVSRMRDFHRIASFQSLQTYLEPG